MKKLVNSLSYPRDLLLLVILAAIPRLLLLISSNAGIESDEAIVGLMAKHISEGKEIPIFYYGQPYMGSLEAILVAPLYLLFGVNNYCLKLIPLLFSLGYIVITYFLAFKLSGRLTARLACICAALAPSPLIIWSLKARGGFIETIFLGSLSFLICLNIFKSEKLNLRNFAYLGLVLGLGWWTNNQIIFFIAPIGLSILYLLFTNSLYSLKNSFQIAIVGIVSFIIGGLPFWIYNLTEKPKWQSFELLFGQTAGGSSLTYFSDYWSVALPIILGAQKFWSDNETYPSAKFAIYSLLAIIIFFGSLKSDKKERTFFLPLVLFLATTPLIFSLSSFGWLSKAPRYLLPLYSAIPIIIAYATYNLSKDKIGRVAYVFFSLIILHNLASNYLDGTIADEGQPMVYQGSRVSEDHTALYKWLEEHSCNHIHTNYWIGYRTALETREEITFTRFGTPRSLRLPNYEEAGKISEINNPCGKTMVLVDKEVEGVKKWLNSLGQSYSEDKASNYNILYNIQYKQNKGTLVEETPIGRVFIPPDNSSLKDLSKSTNLLFDHSLLTRWGSGEHQKPGMALEIDFQEAVDLGSINIKFGKFKHDSPSSLAISAYLPGGDRVFLFNMSGTRAQRDIQYREFGDIEDSWDIRFNTIKTSRVRFELMEENPIFDWSIAELEFYAPPALEDNK